MHAFAPYAITKLSLPLEDENTSARLRHTGGKRRSGETTTDDDQVVTHRISRRRVALCSMVSR